MLQSIDMAPELKPEKKILLDEMLGEPTRHTVIQLPSGAVVDRYTNPREKPQQKRESNSLDYDLSCFAAGINERRRQFRRHHR